MKTCPVCGVEFKRLRGPGWSTGAGIHCSVKCAGVAERGNKNHRWNGGRIVMKSGHIRVLAPGHPFANKGYVLEHRLIVERVIGRYLKRGEVVHHVNLNPGDNWPSNFVLCPDESYHQMLHARLRVVRRGGNPNTHLICSRCDQVLPRESFTPHEGFWRKRYSACRPCWNFQQRERKLARRSTETAA